MTSWQEKLLSKFSSKSEQYKYVTELPELQEHEELFHQPHQRSLYTNTFDHSMTTAKQFCQDISNLKYNAASLNLNQHFSPDHYQIYANLQADSERCYVMQLNKYLDTVSALGNRYNYCKNKCLENEPELAQQLAKRKENEGKSNEYFNPMSTNQCLTDCRNQFYFTYKRVSKYFSQDGGFLIESAVDFN